MSLHLTYLCLLDIIILKGKRMKKLLLILTMFNLSVMANDLPIGNYTGILTSPSGEKVAGSGTSDANQVSVSLGKMRDLVYQTGVLTANIMLTGADCFGGVGKLKLSGGSTLNVISTSCQINGNVFTGNYQTIFGGLKLNGSYSFTRQ